MQPTGLSMPDENRSMDELSERWDRLVIRARRINWGDAELGNLGKRCGIPWFQNRSHERISEYLQYDAKNLVLLHGFGRGKIARLSEIVTALLGPDDPSVDSGNLSVCESEYVPDSIPPPPTGPDPREALRLWAVPESFPCRLVRFSKRLQNFLENQGVNTIGDLLATWEQQGRSGLIRQKNLGKKTVEEVAALFLALQSADHTEVSRFLPLATKGEGLSLTIAVAMVAGDLTSLEAQLLHHRLVVGKTLEESAEGTGLTRERVRQIEAGLIADLRERLGYFADSFKELVELWLRDKEWFEVVRPADHAEIIKGALEAIFEELPQAVARRLNDESEHEALLAELRSHPELWFGGIPVHEFLTTRVPEGRHAAICNYLGSSGEFWIDHTTGTLHPRKTGLYRTTVAILEMEDDPIPLTWLIELLRRTGYHLTVSREVLVRYKWRWERTPGFPAERILWNE
jgi:transcriptional regulator with XRE-family HTH domain